MEYRMRSGVQARVIFLAFILLLFGIFTTVSFFDKPDIGDLFLGLTMLGGSVFLATEALRLKLRIDNDSLKVVRAFSSRTILLNEISGYRSRGKSRFHIVIRNGGKPFRIPALINGRKEITEWIIENSEDIDNREHDSEMEGLLKDDKFGTTREERQGKLEKGRKIQKIATAAGFILCLLGIVSPKPYGVLMSFVFLAPGIGIFLTWYFDGLFKMYKKKSSPYPSLVFLVGFPIIGALVCVFHSYDLYGPGLPGSFWCLLFGCTVLLTVICITVCRRVIKKEGGKLFIICGIFVLAGIYSYSFLIFSNCYYDKSAAEEWPVKIVNRGIFGSRIKSYDLTVSPWGRFKNDNKIDVSGRYFDKVQDADGITVYLEKGIWGVPWYRLEK